jgi:hypothetical protein
MSIMDDFRKIYDEMISPHLSMTQKILPFKKIDYHNYTSDYKRYLVSLKNMKPESNKEITFNYYSVNEPTNFDVFAYICFMASCSYHLSFMAFCTEFHYDSDRIKVRNKYKECKKIRQKLQSLVGDDVFLQVMTL